MNIFVVTVNGQCTKPLPRTLCLANSIRVGTARHNFHHFRIYPHRDTCQAKKAATRDHVSHGVDGHEAQCISFSHMCCTDPTAQPRQVPARPPSVPPAVAWLTIHIGSSKLVSDPMFVGVSVQNMRHPEQGVGHKRHSQLLSNPEGTLELCNQICTTPTA